MKCIISIPKSCDKGLVSSFRQHFLSLTQEINQEIVGDDKKKRKHEVAININQSGTIPGFHVCVKIISLTSVSKHVAEKMAEKILNSAKEAGIIYAPEGEVSVYALATFHAFPSALCPERHLVKGPHIFNPEEEAEESRKKMNKKYMLPG